jgi:hypothetical protein
MVLQNKQNEEVQVAAELPGELPVHHKNGLGRQDKCQRRPCPYALLFLTSVETH